MSYVTVLRAAEKSLRYPVAFVCAYEAVALLAPKNRYTPPISVIAHRHKWVFPFFCGALGVHIWWLETEL